MTRAGKCSRETPLNSSFSNILPLMTSECKNRIIQQDAVLIAESGKPALIVSALKLDIAPGFFPDKFKSLSPVVVLRRAMIAGLVGEPVNETGLSGNRKKAEFDVQFYRGRRIVNKR